MPWGNNSREDNNEPLPVCKFSDKRLIQVLHYQHQHLVFLILESVLYKQDFVALGFHSYTLDVLWPKPGMAGSIDLWAIMDPVYHPGDCGIVFFKQLQYFPLSSISAFTCFRIKHLVRKRSGFICPFMDLTQFPNQPSITAKHVLNTFDALPLQNVEATHKRTCNA